MIFLVQRRVYSTAGLLAGCRLLQFVLQSMVVYRDTMRCARANPVRRGINRAA